MSSQHCFLRTDNWGRSRVLRLCQGWLYMIFVGVVALRHGSLGTRGGSARMGTARGVLRRSPWRCRPWWSVLGLCYASGWHQALPCNPAYAGSNPSSTPDRLSAVQTIVRNLIPGSTVDFSGTPLHKIEGLNLEYPPQATTVRVQGQVQLTAVVDSRAR